MDETPLRKEGRNPVCGDEITVYGRIESDRVAELSFGGHGCSISIAAADMLCGALTGRTVEEGREIIERYLRLVEEGSGETFADDLEELNAMGAVRAYPSRIDCAVLAWRTAQEALRD
jgi:nitrogen fixation NifU-like protein